MRLRNLHIILLYLLIFPFITKAEEKQDSSVSRFRYAVFNYAMVNHYRANFSMIEGFGNMNAEFRNEFTTSDSYGAKFGWLINDDWELGFKMSLSSLGGEFRDEEFIGFAEVNKEPFEVYSVHTFESTLGRIDMTPYISFNIYSGYRMELGFMSGISNKAKISFKEALRDDAVEEGILFIDEDRSTDSIYFKQEGELSKYPLYLASSIGFTKDFNLFDKFKLTPEIHYLFNVKNMIDGIDWKIHSLQIGVSVSYISGDEYEIPIERTPVEIQPETITISKVDTEAIETKNEIASTKEIIEAQAKTEIIPEKCCKILLYSSIKESESINFKNWFVKQNQLLIGIESTFDNEENKTYFRVVSNCYSNEEEAFLLKKQLLTIIKKYRKNIEPYLLCD